MTKTRKRLPLRLYVWANVLRDYTAGVMFALASSPEAARKAIIKAYPDYDTVVSDLASEPQVVTKTEGFAVWGGG